MVDYLIVEKERNEFQKLLNQYKHLYKFEIIWMFYNEIQGKYQALIKRESLCTNGTRKRKERCMKCGAEYNG